MTDVPAAMDARVPLKVLVDGTRTHLFHIELGYQFLVQFGRDPAGAGLAAVAFMKA